MANIIENTLNTIRNIQNTSENIKNRIGKQHNKIPNLILAVITPHRILVEKFRSLFGRLLYPVVKILNFSNVEKISKILLKMVQVRRKTNKLLKCRDEAKLKHYLLNQSP